MTPVGPFIATPTCPSPQKASDRPPTSSASILLIRSIPTTPLLETRCRCIRLAQAGPPPDGALTSFPRKRESTTSRRRVSDHQVPYRIMLGEERVKERPELVES